VPQLQVEEELSHWKPLLQWMRPMLQPAANTGPAGSEPARDAAARSSAAPVVDQPKPETLSRGPRPPEAVTAADAPRSEDGASAASRLRDALPLPRFLQRKP
jgi:hypothetical protein